MLLRVKDLSPKESKKSGVCAMTYSEEGRLFVLATFSVISINLAGFGYGYKLIAIVDQFYVRTKIIYLLVSLLCVGTAINTCLEIFFLPGSHGNNLLRSYIYIYICVSHCSFFTGAQMTENSCTDNLSPALQIEKNYAPREEIHF